MWIYILEYIHINAFVILIKVYSKINLLNQLCENTNNLESGCGSNCSLQEGNTNTFELQLVQGLFDSLFDSHVWRIPDYHCENCNEIGFCTTFISISSIVEMLIV